MSRQLQVVEHTDGYISDVPTQGSNAQSEISQDLLLSTRALEKHFKDKYRILRSAYEQRIKQLSEVIHQTCSSLFSDELLGEMKNDQTSRAFIPAHLSELIDNHLKDDRERFVHQIVTKLSKAELEVIKVSEDNAALHSKLQALEKESLRAKQLDALSHDLKEQLSRQTAQFDQYSSQAEAELSDLRGKFSAQEKLSEQLKSKIDYLSQSFTDKAQECEQLKNLSQAKSHDLTALEQSFQQSSREFAIIEGMDKQEQQLKKELRDKLNRVSLQRDELNEEVQELRVKMQFAMQELSRNETQLSQRANEEAANKDRIAALMTQVESMLAQEASESNAAIAAVHEKMKLFRQRMISELQREKRFSAAMQEELAKMKTIRDDGARDTRRLSEEVESLRERLGVEQEKYTTSTITLQQANSLVNELKVKIVELEFRVKQSNDRLVDFEKAKKEEFTLLLDKAKLQAEKEMEHELSQLDKRTSTVRLHYQNELGVLQNQLRHSYTFGSHPDSDLATELSFKQILQGNAEEVGKMKQAHANEIAALDKRRLEEVNARMDTEESNRELKRKLVEAGQHIERLRGMLLESQSMLTQRPPPAIQTYYAPQQNQPQFQPHSQHQQPSFQQHQQPPHHIHMVHHQQQTSVQGNRDNLSTAASYAANTSIASYDSNIHGGAKSIASRVSSQMPPRPPMIAGSIQSGVAGRSVKSVTVASVDVASIRSTGTRVVANDQIRTPDSGRSRNDVGSSGRNIDHHDQQTAPASNSALITSALEEARVAKLRVMELESEFADLQSALIEMEKQKDELSSENREAFESLDRSNSEISKLQTELQELQSQFDALKAQDCSSTIASEFFALDDGTSLPQTQRSNRSRNTSVEHVQSQTLEVNATSSFELQQKIAEQLSQSLLLKQLSDEADKRTMEESVVHHIELLETTRKEVTFERERALDARRREAALYKLLVKVDTKYKSEIVGLRSQLAQLKGSVESLGPQTALEVNKTVSGLGLHLKRIFEKFDDKQRRDMHAMRITLTNAHNDETSQLEKKFIDQIRSLSKQHASELEQMHDDLIGKTQRVIEAANLSGDSQFFATMQRKPQNSFGLESQSEEKSSSHKAASLVAYESVLKGVVGALVSLEMIQDNAIDQLTSLAETHFQPSFAATAAAKAIVAEQIERFLMRRAGGLTQGGGENIAEDSLFLQESEMDNASTGRSSLDTFIDSLNLRVS